MALPASVHLNFELEGYHKATMSLSETDLRNKTIEESLRSKPEVYPFSPFAWAHRPSPYPSWRNTPPGKNLEPIPPGSDPSPTSQKQQTPEAPSRGFD